MLDVEETSRNPESREGMLKITEIFHSLQGEALQAGLPTVFVRLTGCPLRCTYCDSEYAFYGGEWMHFDDILAEIRKHDTPYVCVTGGVMSSTPLTQISTRTATRDTHTRTHRHTPSLFPRCR